MTGISLGNGRFIGAGWIQEDGEVLGPGGRPTQGFYIAVACHGRFGGKVSEAKGRRSVIRRCLRETRVGEGVEG